MGKLKLTSLSSLLYASGHSALWFAEEYDPSFPAIFLTVLSADERELAWWDDGSGSWILTREANYPCPTVPGLEPSSGDYLDPASIKFHTVVSNC